MARNDRIQLFGDKRIRTAWDEEKKNGTSPSSMFARC